MKLTSYHFIVTYLVTSSYFQAQINDTHTYIFSIFAIFSCKSAPHRTRICTCQRVDGCECCLPPNTRIREGFVVQARNARIGTIRGLERDWAADVPCYCNHHRLEYDLGSDRGLWWLPLRLVVLDDNTFQLFHDTAVYRHPTRLSSICQVPWHPDRRIEIRGDDIPGYLEVSITLMSLTSSSSTVAVEAMEMRLALSPKAKRHPDEFL